MYYLIMEEISQRFDIVPISMKYNKILHNHAGFCLKGTLMKYDSTL